MPQMSPMDWLILSFFLLLIYLLGLMYLYFMIEVNLSNNYVFKKNNFIINW
uniref:ATP synthase F0 subunit 8 n=1 Tax=Diachasmimorpha longicaudata TaxID=58733 RepID=D8WHB6_9HYME|nr:ATP synthase F0 subunit 8 [Diachasmimorpha longicaudata]